MAQTDQINLKVRILLSTEEQTNTYAASQVNTTTRCELSAALFAH